MSRRRSAPAPVSVQTSQGVAELVADPANPGGRILYIGGLASSHVDLDDPATLRMDYLHRLARALDVLLPRGAPADVVHLGGGAFALPRALAATRPRISQEVYEIEPGLVELARAELRLRRTAALRVRVGDAAERLAARPDDSADAIVCDAFVGTDIPPALTTDAFMQHVRRVLRPGGAYLVNVVDAPPWAATDRVKAALRPAFDRAFAFGAREVVRRRRAGNVLIVAGSTLRLQAFARGLAGGPYPAHVRPLIEASSPDATLHAVRATTPLR
ncbi:MAG: hypothetical protein QOF76_2254 [Solirubrobacteraceae bacterium]|nr:hypothetical protein [Solirubrobacteraceae bacterium]